MAAKKQNLSEVNIDPVIAGKDLRFALVVSQWNPGITEALAKGAHETLLNAGIPENNILKLYVPGSFELPLGAQHVLEKENPDAVLCLGCVIQGETRHFEFICQAVAHGITRVGLDYGKPVIFGVLTTDNMQQAIDRSGGSHGNKGIEAAATALQMVQLTLRKSGTE